MSVSDVVQFLSYLAVKEKVAVKTQALALNSISFLYREKKAPRILPKICIMCSLSMNFYRRRRSYSAGCNDFLYDNGISPLFLALMISLLLLTIVMAAPIVFLIPELTKAILRFSLSINQTSKLWMQH